MTFGYRHATLFALLLSCHSGGQANTAPGDPPCQQASTNCREIGRWELSLALGAGARSNPLVDGDPQPLVLVPQFSWYGERFFVDNFEAGVTLVDRPRHMLNLLVTPGFDKFFFDDGLGFGNFILEDSGFIDGGDSAGAPDEAASPTQKGDAGVGAETKTSKVDERRLAVMGGLDYGLYLDQWLLSLQLLNDVSGVHDGQELRLAASWHTQWAGNGLSVSLGAIWQDQDLLNYYYGLEPHEVNDAGLTFRGKADWSPLVKLQWRRPLTDKWSFYSTLHYKQFGKHTADSPLLVDDYVITGFIGGIYHF